MGLIFIFKSLLSHTGAGSGKLKIESRAITECFAQEKKIAAALISGSVFIFRSPSLSLSGGHVEVPAPAPGGEQEAGGAD